MLDQLKRNEDRLTVVLHRSLVPDCSDCVSIACPTPFAVAQERDRLEAKKAAEEREKLEKESWIDQLVAAETPSWKRDLLAARKKPEPTAPEATVQKQALSATRNVPADTKPQIKLF